MAKYHLQALIQILEGEQAVIQRTDQKALTLLSILGVFMVFFIVHFPKLQMDRITFSLVLVYFSAAIGTMYNLVRVIIPRLRKETIQSEGQEETEKEYVSPTFFAGISQFNSPEEYSEHLKSKSNDEDQFNTIFSHQVFSLGKINQLKNEYIRLSTYFFITALTSELAIIIYMAYARALPFLFPEG